MEAVVLAVRTIVMEFTQYARPDLWHEFSNAQCYDLGIETGLPHVYYGASSSQRQGGEKALLNLMNRSRAVLEAKSGFSEYTIKFATYCDKNFDTLSETIEKRLAVYETIEKRLAV